MPGNGVGAQSKLEPRGVVLAVCCFVLIAATATVIYATIMEPPKSETQYQLTVALLCFALASVSALLFVASDVKITGTIWLLSISAAGPAFAWLIALLVFRYLFPQPVFDRMKPQALTAINDWIADLEEEGWIGYPEWKTALGPRLSKRFKGTEEEERSLKVLLSSAFVYGQEVTKLRKANIKTVFVFPKTSASFCPATMSEPSLKLQRIYSDSPWENEEPFVYVGATMSTPGAPVESVIFVRDETGRVTFRPPSSESFWLRLEARPVDVLVVSRYCDPDNRGDTISVDVPKYVQGGAGRGADVDLAIVAAKSLSKDETSLWEIRGDAFKTRGDVPLVFRQLERKPADDISDLREAFGPWLTALGGLSASDEVDQREVFKFRDEVLPLLKPRSSEGYLSDDLFPDRVVYHLEGQRRPVIMAYFWR